MSLNILYVSCLCSKKREEQILSADANGIGLQIQKYHRLLAQGLVRCGGNVQSLSYHQGVSSIDMKKTQDEEDGILYHYLTTVPEKRMAHISIVKQSYSYARKYFEQCPNGVVICDVLNFSVSLGAVLAARRMRRPAIGIITDFPEQLGSGRNLFSVLVWKLIYLCTAYILLTEAMRDFVSPKKPSIVLEGHANEEMLHSEHTPFGEEKHIIYAGSLHKKYGIANLCSAFADVVKEKEYLHVYGDGDYTADIREISKQNSQIIYYGVRPNQEVVQKELGATLLVNPRPATDEYTKYSFPSKTMEYMASGTPVAMTRLPGMPEEYCDYVYLFDSASSEDIAKKLREILDKPNEELEAFGAKAKRFVMENKTNVKQAEKILRFIEEEL